jgi:outer membrane immunogenic protein
MRKLLLGSIAILALTAVNTAIAAALPSSPSYKAPTSTPAFNWKGCYAGVQGGYAWGRDSDDESIAATGMPSNFTPAGAASPDGATIGGYAGCNWQVSAFVLGLEGDGEYVDAKDSNTYRNTGPPPDFYETTIRSQWAIRGRTGYAIDRLLLYFTAGIAFADINEHDQAGVTGQSTDNSTTRRGWTVGSGLDYAFVNNLIGRIEYRYADFGRFGYTPAVFSGFTEKHSVTESAIYFGLAYKFW